MADLQTSSELPRRDEAAVLVVYTGGTIGMVRNLAGVLVPEPNALEANIRRIVTMHDETFAQERFGARAPLVLPPVPGHKRVLYTICEYDPLLDSSNMLGK